MSKKKSLKQKEMEANRRFLDYLRESHEKRNSEIFKKIKKRNSWR